MSNETFDGFDALALGRLIERVEQIADRLEADRSAMVPREVCDMRHVAVSAGDVALRQRVTDLESAQIADRRLAEDRADRRANDRWARVFGALAIVVSLASAVIGAAWK